MPYVLKIVDIMENVSNRTFESEGYKSFTDISEASFVPRGGVVKKAGEVIDKYTPLEGLFIHYLDDYNPSGPNVIYVFDYTGKKITNGIKNILGNRNLTNNDSSSEYEVPLSYHIAKRAVSRWRDIMPTQWAILTLFGLGPNEIFEPNPKGGLPIYK